MQEASCDGRGGCHGHGVHRADSDSYSESDLESESDSATVHCMTRWHMEVTGKAARQVVAARVTGRTGNSRSLAGCCAQIERLSCAAAVEDRERRDGLIA